MILSVKDSENFFKCVTVSRAMQHFDALADSFEAAELTEQGYHQAAAIAQEIMSTGGIRHL